MAGGVARMLAQYARGLRFNTRYWKKKKWQPALFPWILLPGSGRSRANLFLKELCLCIPRRLPLFHLTQNRLRLGWHLDRERLQKQC
jgi:hypothetical protein